MELEEYDDQTNMVLRYLEELINFSSYGDCAGLATNLTKLHRNKVKSQVLQDMLLMFLVGYDTDDCPQPVKILREKFSNLHPAPDEISYEITEDLSYFQYNHGMDTEEFIEKYREKILSHLGNLGDSDIREINEYLLSHECPSLDFAENVNVVEYLKKSLTDKIDELHERSDLFIVSGEPGEGKSIFMKQLASDFAYDVLERLDKYKISSDGKIHLPFFLEAKSLARQLSPNPEENDFSFFADKEMINHPLYLYTNNAGRDYFSPDYNEYPLIKALQKNIPNTSEEFLLEIFRYCKNDNNERVDNLNCVFFIDAFDECTIDEKIMLKGWINKLRADARFVISSREQHVDDLVQSLELGTLHRKCGTLDDFSKPVLLEMNFTEEELIHQMPQKLASAWGMNEFVLELKVNQKIDNYRKILTHPVFVGLFCRFVSEGELDNYGINVPFNGKEMSFNLGGYSLQHIEFYNKIYDHSFSRLITKNNLANIRIKPLQEAFLLIAWYYEYFMIEDFERLLHLIEVNHDILLNKEERKILSEDMGVMYVVGTDFKWTHKTLRELAIGKLIHKNERFRNSFSFSYNKKRFRNRDWDTAEACVLLSYVSELQKQTGNSLSETVDKVIPSIGQKFIDIIFSSDKFFVNLISYDDFSLNLDCEITTKIAYKILKSKVKKSYGSFSHYKINDSMYRNLTTEELNFVMREVEYIRDGRKFQNIHSISLEELHQRYDSYNLEREYLEWVTIHKRKSLELEEIIKINMIYIHRKLVRGDLPRGLLYNRRLIEHIGMDEALEILLSSKKWFLMWKEQFSLPYNWPNNYGQFRSLRRDIRDCEELINSIIDGRHFVLPRLMDDLDISIFNTRKFRDIILVYSMEVISVSNRSHQHIRRARKILTLDDNKLQQLVKNWLALTH